jgi:hypothetical protein
LLLGGRRRRCLLLIWGALRTYNYRRYEKYQRQKLTLAKMHES